MSIFGNIRIRVSGLIIINDKILLISHKKKDKIYWLLPGGGVDYSESLEEGLIREFKEELNIDIKVDKPVIINDSIEPDKKRHILNISFSCEYISGDMSLGEDERLNGYKFFTIDELDEIVLYPPVKKEIKSIFNGEELQNIYLGKLWR
jgi:8-oxo-dGTP diphosphatase